MMAASHSMSTMTGPLGVSFSRSGSGTSWLPDSARMRAVHATLAGWTLMLHGAAFGTYNDQQTIRGAHQLGELDWEMMTAARPLAGGVVRVNAMTSLDAVGVGPRGYPLLLQTGETYRNGAIHDRQHPHELFMELASMYERPISNRLAFSLYAGAVGEPALGPVAFMHRPSAENDPFAPIGHHWQDATHESFGVATLGLYTRVAKLEGSVFNAREPDDYRFNLDFKGARLDSYAGRLSVTPTPSVVASAWWGFLYDHDRLETGGEMHRYGVSLLTTHPGGGIAGGDWSTAAMWGENVHHHTGADHAAAHGDPAASPHHHSASILLESNLEIGARNVAFARVERIQKSGEELGFLGGDLTQLFDIRTVTAGYVRQIATLGDGELGLGARAAMNFLPPTLELVYGTRRPVGVALYLRLRVRRTGGMSMRE